MNSFQPQDTKIPMNTNSFQSQDIKIPYPSQDTKNRRPKQKVERSDDEFKQHERLIMDKRIAEINNVITKV